MGSPVHFNVGVGKIGLAEKIRILEIKIHTKVSSDYYIIDDETDNILLGSKQNLKEDSCYKLVKPGYEENKLKRIQSLQL